VRHPCFDSLRKGENAFSTPMKAKTQHGEATEHVAYFANSEQPRFIEPRRCELPISSGAHPCPNAATKGEPAFTRPKPRAAKGASKQCNTTSKQAPGVPKWSALLVEAVNKPGLIMEAYSAFHPTRSEIKSSPSCNANCADLKAACAT
jgi:hypothetical protein